MYKIFLKQKISDNDWLRFLTLFFLYINSFGGMMVWCIKLKRLSKKKNNQIKNCTPDRIVCFLSHYFINVCYLKFFFKKKNQWPSLDSLTFLKYLLLLFWINHSLFYQLNRWISINNCLQTMKNNHNNTIIYVRILNELIFTFLFRLIFLFLHMTVKAGLSNKRNKVLWIN